VLSLPHFNHVYSLKLSYCVALAEMPSHQVGKVVYMFIPYKMMAGLICLDSFYIELTS